MYMTSHDHYLERRSYKYVDLALSLQNELEFRRFYSESNKS